MVIGFRVSFNNATKSLTMIFPNDVYLTMTVTCLLMYAISEFPSDVSPFFDNPLLNAYATDAVIKNFGTS